MLKAWPAFSAHIAGKISLSLLVAKDEPFAPVLQAEELLILPNIY
jgi:hypothetical protein